MRKSLVGNAPEAIPVELFSFRFGPYRAVSGEINWTLPVYRYIIKWLSLGGHDERDSERVSVSVYAELGATH